MARTKQRTRLQDFIVTSGDVVRGEDGTAPTDLLVRGGESDGTALGASLEARGGDGTGFKFGTVSITSSTGAASVVFTTPFPPGPPLVIQVSWVFTGAGAPATLPASPIVVHSVGPTGFSLSWLGFGFAAPVPYDIHWTARQ